MSATRAGTWVCLNSDGAVKLDTGLVAAKGVLRGRHGGWILGFNRSLGYCSVFNAELWGVLDDLMILKSRKYDRVLIRIDSQKLECIPRERNLEADRIAKMTFNRNEGLQLVKDIPLDW
ncbi:hypothetical protein Goklo_000763, partial [Gossypium klotzschianum]|nr:hypothetical protein [Gossypium klotzschianum]